MNQGPNFHFSAVTYMKSPADFERVSARFREIFDKLGGNSVRSAARLEGNIYTFQVTSNMVIEALPMRTFVEEIYADDRVALIYHHSNCSMEEPVDLGPEWKSLPPVPSRVYLVSVSVDYAFGFFNFLTHKRDAFVQELRDVLGFTDFAILEDDRRCGSGLSSSGNSIAFYVEFVDEVPQELKDKITALIKKYNPGISVLAILEN